MIPEKGTDICNADAERQRLKHRLIVGGIADERESIVRDRQAEYSADKRLVIVSLS